MHICQQCLHTSNACKQHAKQSRASSCVRYRMGVEQRPLSPYMSCLYGLESPHLWRQPPAAADRADHAPELIERGMASGVLTGIELVTRVTVPQQRPHLRARVPRIRLVCVYLAVPACFCTCVCVCACVRVCVCRACALKS